MYKEALCKHLPEYQTHLYRLAFARLRNRTDAEDAVQEALVRAWIYCEDLAKEDAFASWLKRILVNECNNILRKKKRTHEICVGNAPFLVFSALCEEKVVFRMDFCAALNALDDCYRIPIQMIFLHGFTSEETAARLHMTRSAVSGMVRRGKERLRAAV